MPATSSITILRSSFFLNIFSAGPETIKPSAVTNKVAAIYQVWLFFSRMTGITAAALVTVPGISGLHPIKKKVLIILIMNFRMPES